MNQYIAQETAVIDASAETIYRILIDYNDPNAHPAITPKHFFTKIEVVSGGIRRNRRRCSLQSAGADNAIDDDVNRSREKPASD